MHTIKYFILFIFLFPLASAKSYSATLCTADEVVLFSCNTKTKNRIISLCGSIKTNGPTSYIQYRFGTQKRLELVYPTDKRPAVKLFTTELITSAGGSYDAYVIFTIDEYSYSIYSGNYVGGSVDDINNDSSGVYGPRAGVEVSRQGKFLIDIRCNENGDEGNPGELTYKVESYLSGSLNVPSKK
jgi:hypothetical protein